MKYLVSLFSSNQLLVTTVSINFFPQILCAGKTSFLTFPHPIPMLSNPSHPLLTISGRLLIFSTCIMGITLSTSQVYKAFHTQQELKIVIVLPQSLSTYLCSLKAESVLSIFAFLSLYLAQGTINSRPKRRVSSKQCLCTQKFRYG